MSDLDGVCMVKRGNTLVPADFHADEFMETIKEGREVIVTVRKARSPLHHRWFFGLLRQVVRNTEGKWGDEDDLLDDLKFATGHRRRSTNLLTGEEFEIARSISFAAMPEDKFTEFKKRCVDILTQHLGWDVTTLMKEVDDTQRRHGQSRRQ